MKSTYHEEVAHDNDEVVKLTELFQHVSNGRGGERMENSIVLSLNPHLASAMDDVTSKLALCLYNFLVKFLCQPTRTSLAYPGFQVAVLRLG